MTWKIDGASELGKKIAELTNSETKRAVGGAVREGLKPVLADARANAPFKSGALRRSIKIKAVRSRKMIGARVSISGTGNEYQGKQFYGAFQEFGWKSGSRRGRLQIARSIASRLRVASRNARDGKGKGLAKLGTDFRAKQESYFAREGARLAANIKEPKRKQIEPKNFMRNAAKNKRDEAIAIFNSVISKHIQKVMSRRK